MDPSGKYGSKVEYNYARYCSGCHNWDGVGKGRIGRFKRLEPANLTAAAVWEGRSDEELIHSIASGKGDMPAFSYYPTGEEQRALLAFIKAKFRPTPDKPDEGNAAD